MALLCNDFALSLLHLTKTPGRYRGFRYNLQKVKTYCSGAAPGPEPEQVDFMLGAPLSIAGGDAGLLPWPVVNGGLVELEATRFASRPLLNAKIKTRATTAKPAIHPQVELDQNSDRPEHWHQDIPAAPGRGN